MKKANELYVALLGDTSHGEEHPGPSPLYTALNYMSCQILTMQQIDIPKLKKADVAIIDGDCGTQKCYLYLRALRQMKESKALAILVGDPGHEPDFATSMLDAGADGVVNIYSDPTVILAHIHSQLRSLNLEVEDFDRDTPEERIAAGRLAFTPGEVIDHYRLETVLGAGGMGVVYMATDVNLDRKVALKLLPDDAATNDEYLARFRREGEIMARLNHPQIVRVLDTGDNPYYLVMEFIEGKDIQTMMDEKLFDEKKAATFMAEVCSIMYEVHKAGVVHRDLKPGNLIMDADGVIHVLDFGISKLLGAEVVLTNPGACMGTPVYMAPEQLDPSLGEVSPQSDIYTLGLILYEMMTGKIPFRNAGTFAAIKEILMGNPMSVRAVRKDISKEMDAIILKATSRKPEKRYASCKAFADDLQRLLNGEPPLAMR